mgnify:FL=1
MGKPHYSHHYYLLNYIVNMIFFATAEYNTHYKKSRMNIHSLTLYFLQKQLLEYCKVKSNILKIHL